MLPKPDELPQIINILKGEMSIVGPRPERVENVEIYTKDVPEFAFRAKVKGGLTGYRMAEKYDLPILYSCHPRSKKRLEQMKEEGKYTLNPRVIQHEPLGFHDYNCLQMNIPALSMVAFLGRM